eukprot:13802495-Alexandrium_andersonii.AAC.1
MVCLVEHHLSAVETRSKQLGKRGWRTVWTPARRTTAQGTRGGSVIAFPFHLKVYEACNSLSGGQEQIDWTAVKCCMKGFRFVVVALYMTHGINATCIGPENWRKLAGLSQMLLSSCAPFVVLADWNMRPEILAGSGLLQQWSADIVLPRDAEMTCRGGRGSLIDFAVISHSFAPHVRALELDPLSPWSPHIGIVLGLCPRPDCIRMLTLVRPPLFDLRTRGEDGAVSKIDIL